MPDAHDLQLINLIKRVAAHDDEAFKLLYDQTASRLFGLALRICANREWAEDALQDAFVQVWKTSAEYQKTLSPPLAWLGLIVRSRALDQLRRRKAEREHLSDEWDEEKAPDMEDTAQDPQDLSTANELATALHQCLTRLDKKQREAVSLAYLRDLSHSELALELGLPLGTVKSWIRRGLEQLRDCMSRYA